MHVVRSRLPRGSHCLATVVALSQNRSTVLSKLMVAIAMPQYFFAIRAGDTDTKPERAAVLRDDAAAFACACEIARELSRNIGSTGPRLLVKVRDHKRGMIFSLPVFAACA
jgi:hypothetical protein